MNFSILWTFVVSLCKHFFVFWVLVIFFFFLENDLYYYLNNFLWGLKSTSNVLLLVFLLLELKAQGWHFRDTCIFFIVCHFTHQHIHKVSWFTVIMFHLNLNNVISTTCNNWNEHWCIIQYPMVTNLYVMQAALN
jgi:hypothetical protein